MAATTKKIEIPGEQIRAYREALAAEEDAVQNAKIRFTFLVGEGDAKDDLSRDLEVLRAIILRVRAARRAQRDAMAQLGKTFGFEPKRVYEIDWKHNTLKINMGLM